MADIFGELNQSAKSPYVDMETNEKVKNYLFARLGEVKKIFYVSEDGETETNIADFAEILADYKFQELKKIEIEGDEIWLDADDGGVKIVAKF
jgi:hypothetical protein